MNVQSSPGELMYNLLRLHEEIDRVALTLPSRLLQSPDSHNPSATIALGRPSLSIPEVTPAAFGFMRTVSWLYMLYFEVARINVDFLRERLQAYDLDPAGKSAAHHQIVHQLRTYLQHHLDITKPHDRLIQEESEDWLHQHCHTRIPVEEQQWEQCLTALLIEACTFLSLLRDCIRYIEQDESREEILRLWRFQHSRYHAPHEFEQVISIAAHDMGRENLDVKRFCARHYQGWMKKLELLEGNYAFTHEARKLIEEALLNDFTLTLPITGHDIMHVFQLSPGPQIRDLLQQARIFFQEGLRSREAILEKLQAWYDTHKEGNVFPS